MKIEQDLGFHYGYPRILPSDEHEITHCPNCNSRILWGGNLIIIESRLQNRDCPVCGFKVVDICNEYGFGHLLHLQAGPVSCKRPEIESNR